MGKVFLQQFFEAHSMVEILNYTLLQTFN